MSDFYKGVIGGAVGVIAGTACFLVGYGSGRSSIVEQCLEHRAFVYGDGAWGCMRLKKAVREVESETIVKPKDEESV